MLSLTLDKTMEQELSQLAQYKGQSFEQFLKDILLEYIEDSQDVALGDSAMEALEQGKDTLISLDDWITESYLIGK